MKLYLLKLAFTHFVADAIPTNISVPGYVIKTGDGKNILIARNFPYSRSRYWATLKHAPEFYD